LLTENKRHHALLDAALNGLDDLLAKAETRGFIADEVGKSAPLLKKISDLLQLNLDERAALKIVELSIAKISEVRRDGEHELRRKFDQYVAGFIQRLKHGPDTKATVARIRDELLQSPALAGYVAGFWQQFRGWLGKDLQEKNCLARQGIATLAPGFGGPA